MTSPKTTAVRHRYFIRVPPKKAFSAITDPRWLVRWLCDTAEVEPRRGGRYSLGWTDGPVHTGEILEFVAGKKMTLAWEWPGVELRGTRFSLSVARKGAGSLVTVEHLGFPVGARWMDLYGGAEWGWTYFLLNLKSVLERGHDLRSAYDG